MGIVGVSQGLDDAQQRVLSPLGSVGTDILVTRTVAATGPTASSSTPSPSATTGPDQAAGGGPGGGGGFFGAGGGGGGRGADAANALASLNSADAAALLNENSSVITDLSKLGTPGTRFTHDFFLAGTLITFPQEAVADVKAISGVTSVTSALTLQAQHESGTVPRIVASVKTGGETISSTVRPAPLTESEQVAFRDCISKNGGFPTTRPRPTATGTGGTGGRGGGGFGGGGGFFGLGGFSAAQKCLPVRFQQYQANVITPLRTIQQVVDPPRTDTASQSWTAAGVDPASPNAGLVTKANLAKGAWFSATGNAQQVLVSTAYATRQKLSVGSRPTINGTTYTVVGLVDPTLTGNTADVYFTLPTMQALGSKSARVNEVLVKVDKASDVDAVAAKIKTALPGAQVVTGKDVADKVTGSLHNAQQLASHLGGALAVIVLLAAFAIAVLLTLSSVAKRVREIGTLRALGWTRRRVVGQLVAETLGIGVIGGALGVALGYLASVAVSHFSPALSATSDGVAAGASSVGRLFGQQTGAGVTSSVQLTAPITLTTIALGFGCALVGGLLAGAVGGWRAARLSPSVALRDLG